MGRSRPIVCVPTRKQEGFAHRALHSIQLDRLSLFVSISFKEAGAMYHLRRVQLLGRCVGLVAGAALLLVPLTAWAEPASPHAQHTAMSHQTPAWAEKLKGQTVVEDTLEGRPERAAMVEEQHQRVMQHMMNDPQLQNVSGGLYNSMTMLHQYGAGGQDLMLVSDPRTEPVQGQGGRCPANAPVRAYDVSAINVEISINQWLDFYPGYMYVLTEDVDKVREEEAKNKAGREKEGHDPG